MTTTTSSKRKLVIIVAALVLASVAGTGCVRLGPACHQDVGHPMVCVGK